MAERTDSLIVGSEFDPSGFTSGLARSLDQYDQFADRIQRPLSMPGPEFDPSAFIQEVIQTADFTREQLVGAINARELSAAAAAAGTATADALQTTLLARVGQLRDELAAELITPAEFRRKADLAMEEFAQEVERQARALPPIPVRVRVQRDPNLFEQQLVPQAELDAAARAATQEGRIGRSGGVNALQGLEDQIRGLKADMLSGAVTNREYQQSLEGIRNEATLMREQGLVQGSKSLAGFNRVMVATEGRVKEGAVAMRQMRLGAAQLAVQAIGTEGAIGQLAQGLLIFGGGSALVVGVGLGIAAIVGLYNSLTDAAHKAEKAQNDLLDAARKRIQGPGETGLEAEAAAADKRRADAAAARRDIERQIFLFGTSLFATVDREYVRQKLITAEREAQVLSMQLGLQVEEKFTAAETERITQQAQDRRAQAASLNQFASNVASAVQSDVRFANSSRVIVALMQQQQAIARNTNLELDVRQRAQTTYNALVQALERPLTRQVELTQQAGQERLRQVQRLQQRATQFDAPVTIRADVTEAERGLEGLLGTTNDEIASLRQLEERFRNNAVLADVFASKRRGLEQLRDSIEDVMHAASSRDISVASDSLQRQLDSLRQLTPEQAEVVVPVRLDDTAAFQQVQDIQARLQARLSDFQQAGVQPPQELVQLIDHFAAQIRESIQAPIEALTTSAGLAANRLQAVRQISDQVAQATEQQTGVPETLGQTADRLQQLQPLVDALQIRFGLVTAEIQRQGGPLQANIELIRTQGELMQQIQQFNQAVPTPIEVTQLAPLEQAVQDFAAAQRAWEFAQASGNRVLQVASQAALDSARNRLDSVRREVVTSVEDLIHNLHLAPDVAERMRAAIEAALERVGVHLDDLSAKTVKFINAMSEIGRAVGGLQDIADALGDMGREGDEAARGLQQAAQAAASFASGDTLGGVIQGVQALISLGHALFGQDETQREHAEILDRNTAALERNTAALERQANSPGGLDTLGEQLRQALGSRVGQFSQSAGAQIFTSDFGAAALDRALRDAGSSLDQLSEIAKRNGIDILDSKGRLVAGTLDQLREALQKSIEEMTTWGTSLDEQTERLNLQTRLFAPQAFNPEQQFKNLANAAGQLSPAIATAFQHLDLKNAPEVRAALQGLFTQFNEGFFTAHPELFGNITKDEFLKFLTQGADFLDTFGDKVKDANDQLSNFNLPRGFREAALAFSNADLGRPGTTGQQIPLTGDTLTPPAAALREANQPVVQGLGDMASKLQVMVDRSPGDILAQMGDMVRGIQVVAEETPDDLLAALQGVRDAIDTSGGTSAAGGNHTEINVYVEAPSTGVLTPQMKRDIQDSVVAGLRRTGLQQTGNTTQVRIR